MPKRPRGWRKTPKRKARVCGRGSSWTRFRGLFSNPLGDEVGIVSALDGSRSYGVVHVGFRRKVIRRPVHVRNGGGGHGMLVRRGIIMERVGGKFGRRGVFLNREVRRVSSAATALDVPNGYRHAVISGPRRKEFGRSGRVAKTVGIVFPLIENDLLPRIRHEVLVREGAAYRYRRLQRGCRFRIERRQIGDDFVPFGRGERRTRRSSLHRNDVRKRGERHGDGGCRRGESRSCHGGAFRGIQNGAVHSSCVMG